MFALTNILSLAEPDPPESRNTDIEMTASQFAAARRVSSAIPSLMKRWRPLNGARPGETIGGHTAL